MTMTPEQIVQKLDEHIEDTLFNDEWLETNEVGCVELLETLRAELQPLADLIRAAQPLAECQVVEIEGKKCEAMHAIWKNKNLCDGCTLRAALDKLAGEQK